MTPTGSPAWTRSATIGAYGGDTNKHNFLSQGVVDPTTDVGAEEFARLTADMVAVVLTAPFCVLTYLNNDSSPAAPTVECVNMMTGVSLVSYPGDSPPAGFPSAARNGTGDVTFTFDTSYSDPYSVAGTFTVEHASASVQDTTAARANHVVSGNTVRVRCFSGGVAVADKRVTLKVS